MPYTSKGIYSPLDTDPRKFAADWAKTAASVDAALADETVRWDTARQEAVAAKDQARAAVASLPSADALRRSEQAALQAAADAEAARAAAQDAATLAAAPTDDQVASLAATDASATRAELSKHYISVAHRPVNLAERAQGMEGTTQDVGPILRQALTESPVVELPAGAAYHFTGAITVGDGRALRGGPGTVLRTPNSTPYVEVTGGGSVESITIDHQKRAGSLGVRIHPTAKRPRLTDVTVIGAQRGFHTGESPAGTRGPSLAPILTRTRVEDASEYGYLFEESSGAIMVACSGDKADLDIIKLRTKVKRLSIIGGEFTGGGQIIARGGSTAGDGLDGFAGAESLFIGGGARFHGNYGNGITLKTDDDSTGTQTVEQYLAENGRPHRYILDGFECSNNSAGNGLTLHRSDDTDSDVSSAGKPLPHLRDFTVSNFLLAENSGRGMLLNARYGHVSAGILLANKHNGLESLDNCRDVSFAGLRAIGNGAPGSSIDGFVLGGKRIRAHQLNAHGVNVYAVSDADLDAVPTAERSTRFGFRVKTGSDVAFHDCGSYHTRVAGLSDADGLAYMEGCDFRNPDGSRQFAGGLHAAAGDVIGFRGGPYLRRGGGGAFEWSANGTTGWTAL